jgi:hypothetical protein
MDRMSGRLGRASCGTKSRSHLKLRLCIADWSDWTKPELV